MRCICGDITQQRAGSTRIKDGSERRTLGEAPHQQILKRLEEKSIFQRCSRQSDTKYVVFNSFPAEGDEDWRDRALNVRKQIKGPKIHTFVHTVFFTARLAGHLVRVTGN